MYNGILGYDMVNGKLVINKPEANRVRQYMFEYLNPSLKDGSIMDKRYYDKNGSRVEADIRKWYVKACLQFGWSKQELNAKIAERTHEDTVFDNAEVVHHAELRNSLVKRIYVCNWEKRYAS